MLGVGRQAHGSEAETANYVTEPRPHHETRTSVHRSASPCPGKLLLPGGGDPPMIDRSVWCQAGRPGLLRCSRLRTPSFRIMATSQR